jgi:alkaline phosphatase D
MDPRDNPAVAGRNSYANGPLLAGPLLGEVGESDAHVWVQARDGQPLTLEVQLPDGGTRSLVAQPSPEEWFCTVFHLTDLPPGTTSTYSLRSENGKTARYPLRLAPPAQARRLKLALGSCYKDYAARELPIFAAIAGEAVDAFLMLGDNCYFTEESEWGSERGMMLSHLRNRNHDSLRPLLTQAPVLAIWDDHDFGPNDSDGTFSHKQTALRCFQRMWAQRSEATAEAPGIYSTVRLGPVELFLTDGRYERRARQHILGARQLTWLKQKLSASTAPIKLVLSGSQVLPEVPALPHFDWECYRRDAQDELAELLSYIEREDLRGVVFASGDPHLGYVLHARGRQLDDRRRGPDFWELTASPLAHVPWPEPLWPADSRDPRFYDRYLLVEMVGQNYGVIDVDLDRRGAELILALRDAEGTTFHAQPVDLTTLAVRPRGEKRTVAVSSTQHAYVFRGAQYVRYDLKSGSPATQSAGPRPISAGWKGVFPESPELDAVLIVPGGKAYFFRGNGYVRYDLSADRADPGYPKYIARHFSGCFLDGLDAAAAWPSGKVYFFRGGQCIRYDLSADRADPGYPKPLAEEFPGIWADGIDTAVCWPDGRAFFYRGDEYIRYDLAAGRPEPGYPKPLADDWLGLGEDAG